MEILNKIEQLPSIRSLTLKLSNLDFEHEAAKKKALEEENRRKRKRRETRPVADQIDLKGALEITKKSIQDKQG